MSPHYFVKDKFEFLRHKSDDPELSCKLVNNFHLLTYLLTYILFIVRCWWLWAVF